MEFFNGGESAARFDFFIIPDIASILSSIAKSQIFIYYLFDYTVKKPIAFYFFKNTFIQYEDCSIAAEDDCDAIQLCASFFDHHVEDFALFRLGFECALLDLGAFFPFFHILWVDHISHNVHLLLGGGGGGNKINCAYYFYNYIVPQSPFNQLKEKIFFLV